MKKSIDASLSSNTIFINSKKKTTMGLDIFSEPIFKLPYGTSPKEIGQKIRECLNAYSVDHPHPSKEEWKAFNQPLISISGVKTSKMFFTKSKMVPISLENDVVTFRPTVNKGWKEGFKKSEHASVELQYSSSSEEDLGLALLKTLGLSTVE